jgi:rhodanese-related sulfurtransferase
MTSNVPFRRPQPRVEAGSLTREIADQRRPDTKRPQPSTSTLAALLIAGAMWVAVAALAVASEPAVTPMSQQALLEHQSKHPGHLFVLDVRTPQEYAEGHVPGAVNVPYDQLASRLAEVPKDKDVVLYCKSGRRAGIAADVLAANGYTRLSHLEGDMNAWIEKGRPVAKP